MNQAEIQSAINFFLMWEETSRDTIDFKKIYVDMADDLISGLVLSQVVYWHLKGANGVTRLRVNKEGYLWIAKKREDWHEEIRITPRQLDRALDILESKGLVATALYGFAGTPTKHIRLRWDTFLPAWQAISTKSENVTFLPNVEMHFNETSNSNTETTTETTKTLPNGSDDEPLKTRVKPKYDKPYLDSLFNVIGEFYFGVVPDNKVGQAAKSILITNLRKAILENYPSIDPDEVRDVALWWKSCHPNLNMVVSQNKVPGYIYDYRNRPQAFNPDSSIQSIPYDPAAQYVWQPQESNDE